MDLDRNPVTGSDPSDLIPDVGREAMWVEGEQVDGGLYTHLNGLYVSR